MRRTLGTTLLALTVLAPTTSCGDDDHSRASGDPAAPVAMLASGTAGGGEVESRATVLEDDAAVASYTTGFRDHFAAKVTRAAARVDVGAGEVLVAAVVSVGCDVPPGAGVSGQGADVVIRAEPVASPTMECFAPVTTVALAAVPQEP